MTLEGRCAIVTGGSRGIGRGISLALARAGADVAIMYRQRESDARETLAQVHALGRRGFAFQADVADYAALKSAGQAAVSALGSVDILVNNAGIPTDGKPLIDADIEVSRRIIEVNAFGPLYLTHVLLPHLRQQAQARGRADIIFLSSTTNITLPAGYTAYCMSKTAIDALTKVLAKEERPFGIRVNAIGPSLADTDMGLAAIRRRGHTSIADEVAGLPFGRAVRPEEIGEMCAFLCSKEAEYITGQVLYVNGGGSII